MFTLAHTTWSLCAFAAVGCVALVGCTADGGEQATFTPEELGAALLTGEDLGSGWTETQRDVFTTREPENPSVEDSIAFCPEAADQAARLDELASDAGADVELEQDLGGEPFHQLRQQAWSDDQVQDYFTTLVEAVDLCTGSTWTDPDGTEVTFESLAAPQVGEETTSIAATAVTTSPDGDTTWRSALTAARFGTVLMALNDTMVGPAAMQRQPSGPDWSTIVTTAADPFAELTAD